MGRSSDSSLYRMRCYAGVAPDRRGNAPNAPDERDVCLPALPDVTPEIERIVSTRGGGPSVRVGLRGAIAVRGEGRDKVARVDRVY